MTILEKDPKTLINAFFPHTRAHGSWEGLEVC